MVDLQVAPIAIELAGELVALENMQERVILKAIGREYPICR